jgi:hypothetical protein
VERRKTTLGRHHAHKSGQGSWKRNIPDAIRNGCFTSTRDVALCLKCAITGHPPTAWRTDEFDPKLRFETGSINGREARQSGICLRACGCAATDHPGSKQRTPQIDSKPTLPRVAPPRRAAPVNQRIKARVRQLTEKRGPPPPERRTVDAHDHDRAGRRQKFRANPVADGPACHAACAGRSDASPLRSR